MFSQVASHFIDLPMAHLIIIKISVNYALWKTSFSKVFYH